MAKVGQVVTIPTGSYCNITLDSGEKIVVNHEPGRRGASTGARLTIDRLKLMGFSSETVVRIDLDTTEGKAALAELMKEGTPGAPDSPLRAFAACAQQCASVGRRARRAMPGAAPGSVTSQ
jgi:hypothetical protein